MSRVRAAAESLRGSFAIAVRNARRRPAIFALASSSLAIALGLATTVIAQIDSLMHPRTPVREPERVYAVQPYGFATARAPRYEAVVAALRSSPVVERVDRLAHAVGILETGPLIGDEQITLAPPSLFGLLGIVPAQGRLFRPDETQESGVALVTHELWRSAYQGRPSLDSATLTFEGRTYRIVGVLPRGITRVLTSAILPFPARDVPRSAYIVRTRAIADSLTVGRAFETIAQQLYTTHGATGRKWFLWSHSLRPDPIEISKLYLAMMGAALLILVIACANVSALMLTRAVAQRRDQALRLAIGASRTDLLAGVAAEATLLAGVGGVAGVLIAHWTMRVMIASTPTEMRWFGFLDPQWNPRVFALLFLVVAATVACASLGPAWYSTRIAPAEPLKDGAGTTTGRPARRFQIVVAMELALSMILLLAGSLVTKSVLRVEAFDFGYDAHNLVVASANLIVVNTPAPRRTDSAARANARWMHVQISHGDLAGITSRIRALPGVRSAVWFTHAYASGGVVVSNATEMLDSTMRVETVYNVGAGFFQTLGLPIIRGRDFEDGDRFGVGMAILDSSGAARLFPAGGAIGGQIKLGPGSSQAQWITVVGVARDAVHWLPEHAELDRERVVYISRADSTRFSPLIVARPEVAPGAIVTPIVHTIQDALPPNTPVLGAPWLADYDERLKARRFLAITFGVLSLASLALATAGLFGVLAYAVSQRMREFAVRIALGASKRDVVQLVLRDGLVMALAGTGVGAAAAMYAGFTLWDWLWGVYPVDAAALIAAELVLIAVTMAASAVPALRATRADPVEVMRAM